MSRFHAITAVSAALGAVLLAGCQAPTTRGQDDSDESTAAAEAMSPEPFLDFDVPPIPVNGAEEWRRIIEFYPPRLRRSGEEAKTVLWIRVDSTGLPAETRIGWSSGDPEVDTAALNVVAGLRFVPGTKDDRPTDVWIGRAVWFYPGQFEKDPSGGPLFILDGEVASEREVLAAGPARLRLVDAFSGEEAGERLGIHRAGMEFATRLPGER